MQATYGNKFSEMWKGLEMRDVMAIWNSELARYNGAQLQHAFGVMAKQHPSWPPTMFEFAELCGSGAKQEAHKSLPWPAIDHAALDPRIRSLRDMLVKPKSEPRAWAKKILQRHADGDKTVDYIALKMARDSVHIH